MNFSQVNNAIDRRSDVHNIPSVGVETLRVKICRDLNGGLGLSIAGGLGSTPYKVTYKYD